LAEIKIGFGPNDTKCIAADLIGEYDGLVGPEIIKGDMGLWFFAHTRFMQEKGCKCNK